MAVLLEEQTTAAEAEQHQVDTRDCEGPPWQVQEVNEHDSGLWRKCDSGWQKQAAVVCTAQVLEVQDDWKNDAVVEEIHGCAEETVGVVVVAGVAGR